jgi:uncharacterized protein YifE (UPF0438 family)
MALKCKKEVAQVIDKYLNAFDNLDSVDYKYVNQANQAIIRILRDFMDAVDYYGTYNPGYTALQEYKEK